MWRQRLAWPSTTHTVMPASEARVSHDIRAALNAPGSNARIHRNHVGSSWHGDGVRVTAANLSELRASLQPGDVIVRQGRWLESGLRPGSADWIGWVTVPVTPAMVGSDVAVFLSIESKRQAGGNRRAAQQQWADAVLQAGGRAGFARSAAEALAIAAGDQSSGSVGSVGSRRRTGRAASGGSTGPVTG